MKRSFTPFHPTLYFITLPHWFTRALFVGIALCLQVAVFAQSCPNVDFSMGNFSNWVGRTGTYNTPGVFNLPAAGIITPAYHNLMTVPGIDPNTAGGLQFICPGYGISARINSQGNTNGRASQLSYTLTVDPTNALFIYNYAVVLNDGGHSAAEQPKFEIQVRDQFGNIIPCTLYEVAAGNGIPGFITNGAIRWMDWTKVGVDLSSYMGQTVSIEARVAGCVQEQGAHFGYAYIVGECQPLEIDLQFCAGDPAANLSAPDGFVSYQWSTGQTTQNISVPSPAVGQVVTCTLTSVTGCQAVLQVTLNPTVITATIPTTTDVSCFGGNNGSATVVPGGGTSYTYAWTPSGGTAATGTGLGDGTYTVTVTETGGCTATATTVINEPTALTIAGTPTHVNCFGGATGGIDITPSGGTSGYTYLWSNGATTQDLTGIAAGGYTVTVTDANSCTSSYSINITQPAAAVSVTGIPTNVLCFGGNTGSIDITPAGGAPGYTYLWSNGATTQDINSLPAGAYSVTVTDANGCSNSTYAVNITQPAAAISVTGTPTDVTCFGGTNGSIDITPAGGAPGYTYLWSNGATTQDINTLPAGAYSVTVTDANGCTNTAYAANVSQPATPVSVTATSVNVGCFGGATGSVDITPAGGTPGYTYVWSSGQTTQDISGLNSGAYSVTVTDNNSCTTSLSVNITQPAASLTLTGVPTHVLCFGNNTGAIDLTPAGGTPGYTFNWSNGATTEDITGLNAGAYSVTVTDDNSCTNSFSVNITQPAAALSVTGTTSNVNCFGGNNGTIDITPAGGTPGYTYVWSNGAITQDINTLAAGPYSVIITDANGCTNSTYSANITQPAAALAVTGTSVNVGCFGAATGSVDITPADGTPTYTYLWSNGATTQDVSGLVSGNYNVTVTDANGCTNNTFAVTITQPAAALSVTGTSTNVLCFGNTTGAIDITPAGGTPGYTFSWTNGQTTEDATNLAAGSYTVTITDANGCTNNSYNAIITQPSAALTVTGVITNVSCFSGNNGAIDITPAGGTPGYTFAWNNGQTTEDATGLSVGVYAVTITDANGCTNTAYTGNVLQPLAALAVTGAGNDISCNGFNDGSVDITVTGGTSPYNFVWNTGAGSEDIGSLGTGNYSVNITDAKGCFTHDLWTINEPPPMVVNSQVIPNTCYGVADASISLNVNGGTPQYIITWNNGGHAAQLNNLGAGNYSVTITDANNCAYIQNYNIVSAPPLTVTADSLYEIFVGEQVTIHSTGSGGTGALTYEWSPGQDLTCTACQDPVANPLVDMEYTVTVTDANGCTATDVTLIILQYNLFVPNTFTPNGDGDNDSFTAYSASCKEYSMRIFNRWGEEIFSTNDIHLGWDGSFHNTEAKQDVYVYRIEAKFYNGKSQELFGQVNLLR